jgi:hypothetical protein
MQSDQFNRTLDEILFGVDQLDENQRPAVYAELTGMIGAGPVLVFGKAPNNPLPTSSE